MIAITAVMVSWGYWHQTGQPGPQGGNLEESLPSEEIVIQVQIDSSESVLETASEEEFSENPIEQEDGPALFDLESIPPYAGEPYIQVNGNIPFFSEEEKGRLDAFEEYSELDDLGRCGTAYANICLELMPTEERGEIGSIKPSGWHTANYHELINGNYLYNRCHLIGFQLAGENANRKNLITGTRYLNIEGMLPFENAVDDYVEDTGNHVLYRVTPLFSGDDLVARGVLMEGYSVEDQGQGICFCVYCYNVQPGIGIDYATGDSWVEEEM